VIWLEPAEGVWALPSEASDPVQRYLRSVSTLQRICSSFVPVLLVRLFERKRRRLAHRSRGEGLCGDIIRIRSSERGADGTGGISGRVNGHRMDKRDLESRAVLTATQSALLNDSVESWGIHSAQALILRCIQIGWNSRFNGVAPV
jgi:hypothetical protein